MNESHLAYLNLGSNIQPETNLVRAVQLLSTYGEIIKTSNVWESRSVGAAGPNYLNVCVLLSANLSQINLKDQVIRPIETQLGRKRGENKYAPRTIDIDIVLFDDALVNHHFWDLAFVVIPLADIYPEYQDPATGEKVKEAAARFRQMMWLEVHPGVFR